MFSRRCCTAPARAGKGFPPPFPPGLFPSPPRESLVSRAQQRLADVPVVCWRSGRLRVVRTGAQPPQLQLYGGPDGEQPEWYVPALPWASEPAVSALVNELIFELARQVTRPD